MRILRLSGLLFLGLLMMWSCRTDKVISNEDFDVVIRLDRDPGRLNPILSTTSREREIHPYLFAGLADYDPVSLKLSPLLAKELPVRSVTEDGLIRYDFEILEDAIWPNGSPILAKDFLFTLKLVFHPGVKSRAWKSSLDIIKEVIIDSENPRKLAFTLKEENISALPALCTFEVYPEYIYDVQGILGNISLAQIRDEEYAGNLIEQDSTFKQIAQSFSSVKFSNETISGAGPYELDSWETDQYLKLSRKDNWWGNNYPERTLLNAGPKNLIFQIIADETTALTQLQGGAIDVMKLTDAQAFHSMQDDSELAALFSFKSENVLQYFYIAINNSHKILSDVKIREAMAKSIDIERIINVIEAGDAIRVAGPISYLDSSYDKTLNPIALDREGAQNILEDLGWTDTDNSGVLDKEIEGVKTELTIPMFASSDKSEKLCLLVQEDLKKVGINVEITRKKLSVILNDFVYKGDYGIFPLVNRWDLNQYDPHQRWHSDNAKSGGTNFLFYRNEKADVAIDNIRKTSDARQRDLYYKEFQQAVVGDYPIIFMYSPAERIVFNNNISLLTSPKRPGYFANASKFVGELASVSN